MTSELHKFLIEIDEVGNWEYPRASRTKTSWEEIEAIQEEFAAIIPEKFEIDRWVQDASFLTDLALFNDHPDRQGVVQQSFKLAFRFSNFGKMYSMLGSDIANESDYPISQLKSVLRDRGFVYISSEDLDQAYDGKNPPIRKNMTWWDRYFDYL
ncbi:hypothetical protein [Flavilitoribacter nigricans]|uniref:Uncharacterized protein n=1 Tax=Flavilitoribacter nigricans (strain ATCC 23147 / DSM 23189 / NBRC 102662 / NCIMB 1420 / SS-2) TaxID=1122177 RepID=A0A2D0N101_FLAN2|nr:hypothetical protein [Flavilitoribacter nigricans]PHN01393.1 hypothetical protein CRP01_37655 [Flavilitoribacter nigricans DSM 23189 = NBRC 102662]